MTGAERFRVLFDASRCDGYGMCSLVFPERIRLDRWGFAHVDDEPVADDAARVRAERAVRCCPAQALSLSRLAAGERPRGPATMSP